MDTYGILQIFSCLVFRFRHLFGFLRGSRGQASVNQSVDQSVKLPMGAFGRLNPTASYDMLNTLWQILMAAWKLLGPLWPLGRK